MIWLSTPRVHARALANAHMHIFVTCNNMMHNNMLHTNGLLFFASMLMMVLMPNAMPDPIRSFTVAAISAARRNSATALISAATRSTTTVAAMMATATPRWRMHQDGWRRSRTASSASFLCVADLLCCVVLRRCSAECYAVLEMDGCHSIAHVHVRRPVRPQDDGDDVRVAGAAKAAFYEYWQLARVAAVWRVAPSSVNPTTLPSTNLHPCTL